VQQIVRVLLGSGAFNWNDTITTANTVGIFFSFSFFAISFSTPQPCVLRIAKYQNTTLYRPYFPWDLRPALSFYFKNYFGVTGLALGISLGSIFQVILLWMALRKKTWKN
jgi:peptidoglycan biosynthesis protein MviN/MurJ (putative lipid II flippase)